LNNNLELVHEWLGADLNNNLGMGPQLWNSFCTNLTPDLRQLLDLKRNNTSDSDIATAIGCTQKQVHKRWTKLLQLAWETRNQTKG
jgi:hypothetical protein